MPVTQTLYTHTYIYIYIHIVMKTPIKPDFCIYHTFKMGPVSYVGPIFIYWVRDPIIHGPNINIELKLIINISLINTTLSSHNLILGHKTLVCLAISEPGDTMLNYFIQYINWLRICLLEALLQKSVMTTVCATRGNEQPGPKGRPNTRCYTGPYMGNGVILTYIADWPNSGKQAAWLRQCIGKYTHFTKLP